MARCSYRCIVLFLLAISYCDRVLCEHHKKNFPRFKETVPPIFWINLDAAEDRRVNFEAEMASIGVENHHRVSAIHYNDTRYRVETNNVFFDNWGYDMRLPPITIKEFAVTTTHLLTIRAAVEGARKLNSKYALIVEDDISFPFDIDFELMIASAPSDFTILQLETCNADVTAKHWEEYLHHRIKHSPTVITPWIKHIDTSENLLMWGLQAYIINVENIESKRAYKEALTTDTAQQIFHLEWKPFELEEYCSTWRRSSLFGDKSPRFSPFLCCNQMNPEMNIYHNMFPPTYLSRIPLVKHGYFPSNMHTDQDMAKTEALHKMNRTIWFPIRNGEYEHIMPNFLVQSSQKK